MTGTETGEPRAFLNDLKKRLEHQRRFGSMMPNNAERLLTQVEGDIEEWLLAHPASPLDTLEADGLDELLFRLNKSKLYESWGEVSDLPEGAAATISKLRRERDDLKSWQRDQVVLIDDTKALITELQAERNESQSALAASEAKVLALGALLKRAQKEINHYVDSDDVSPLVAEIDAALEQAKPKVKT